MIVDMHMHEATCSSDSFLKLEDMVATARHIGLDAICITDHDSMGLRERAQAYAKRVGYPIFVGVEYYSLQGDIVAFGLDTLPEKRISAQDFIDYVHRQGGVCFAAHPFRSNNRGLAGHLEQVRGLDGIEAFNASTTYEANLRALEVCARTGIQPIGVSDCHVPPKIGVYATCLPDTVDTLEGLIASFKKNRCYPVVLLEGRYVDLRGIAQVLAPKTALLPEADIRTGFGKADETA